MCGKYAMEELPEKWVYYIDIDTGLARTMLARVPGTQRNLSLATVKHYANQIKTGRWDTAVCPPLIFDRNLALVDGQHRLHALVHADATSVFDCQTVWILKRADTTMALPIDQGRRRSRSDHERTYGVSLPPSVSSGLLLEACDFNPSKTKTMSVTEHAEMVRDHPWRVAISNVPKARNAYSGGVAAIARILRHARDPAEVIRFFEGVLNNDHIINGTPSEAVRLLATWLYKAKTAKGRGPTQEEAAVKTLRAWNSHRTNSAKLYLRYVVGENPALIGVVP